MAILSKPLPEPLPFGPSEETAFVKEGLEIKDRIVLVANLLLSPNCLQEHRNAAFQGFVRLLLDSLKPLSQDNVDDPYEAKFRYKMRYTNAMMFSYVEIYDAVREAMKANVYGPQKGYSVEFFQLLASKFEPAYLGVLLAWKMDLAEAAGRIPLDVLAEAYEQHEEGELVKARNRASQSDQEDQGANKSLDFKLTALEYDPVRKKNVLTCFTNSAPGPSNNDAHPPGSNSDIPAGMIQVPYNNFVLFELLLDHLARKPEELNSSLEHTKSQLPGPQPLLGKLEVIKMWDSTFKAGILEGKLRLCPHRWPHNRFTKSGGEEEMDERHLKWITAAVEFLNVARLISKDMAAFLFEETVLTTGGRSGMKAGQRPWTDKQVKMMELEMRRTGAELRKAAVYEWVQCQEGRWRSLSKIERDEDEADQVSKNRRLDEDHNNNGKGKTSLETIQEEYDSFGEDEKDDRVPPSPASPPPSENSEDGDDSEPIQEIESSIQHGQALMLLMSIIGDTEQSEQ